MIVFAVLLVVVTIFVSADTVLTMRRRRVDSAQRTGHRPAPSTPAKPAEPLAPAQPGDLERSEQRLTTRRLSGDLDAASYRDELGALAHKMANNGVFAEARRVTTVDRQLLAHAGRVGTIAPELPLPMLIAVAGVVRYGAEDDDLVRMFGLTPAQAIKIMVFLHDGTRPGA